MAVPYIDLSRQNESLIEAFQERVRELIEKSDFILGPGLARFEERCRDLFKVRHALGVASGTDALMMSLQVCGVGRDDEVILPAFTFVACADVVARLGARPVFVDVDEETFNINPDRIEAAITSRTKAIIVVHLYGRAAPIERICEIADYKKIPVVEDVCQALGTKVGNKFVGTFGRFGCLSFYPTKNLGGLGDGGMILTNSDEDAALLARLRDHGRAAGYKFSEIGYNSRLDSLQAAFLELKLDDFEELNQDRLANARLLNQLISQPGLIKPDIPDDESHTFCVYTIRAPWRDELADYLKTKGIGCAVYYPIPLHLQPCLKYLGYVEGDFPASEKLAREVLSLPVFPGLKRQEIIEVADAIAEFYRTRAALV